MADPRLSASIVGVDAVFATFKIDDSTITYSASYAGGSAQVGLAVNLSDDQTVQLVGDAEPVLGKLIKVEADNMATVQIGGGCTLPGGTSATLTHGKRIVGDLLVAAEGYIREVGDPTTVDPTLAQMQEMLAARHTIIDASTTTAVEVMLGLG